MQGETEREKTHKERQRENKIGKSGNWQKLSKIDQKNRQRTLKKADFLQSKNTNKEYLSKVERRK